MQPLTKALALIPAALLFAGTSLAQDDGKTPPSMELLEFIGSGEQLNGEYIDPFDIEVVSLNKRTQENAGPGNKKQIKKILSMGRGNNDQDSD
ncbi:MAG TPA: hypothetical protein ENK84_04435 [Desulfobulbus sp.]|nr:hypothetical protein [Desulfobulbus sp.]